MSSTDAKKKITYFCCCLLVVAILFLIVYLLNDNKKSEGFSINRYKKYMNSNWGSGVKNRQLDKQYDNSINSNINSDYNSFMKNISLEPEVYDSHNEFSDNVGIANSGASHLPVKSDNNDIVKPWGLRRVNYHDVFALPDARVVHSEHPDQMYKHTPFMLS